MSHVTSLIALKEEMFSRTMQVAPLCPRDKLMWAPAPDALTLGQLLRHMHRSEYNRMRFLRLLGVEKPTGKDWRGPVYGR